MCGILGYSHLKSSLPHTLVASALRGIKHRGPDQQGQYSDRCMSMGAVRLSIVDLEHGSQPFRDDERGVVLVFNGEIFNHQLLRKELEGAGVHFETRCDTEVVLKSFLHWGEQSFARLRGMYAIALWLVHEQRLLLVRDRMGIKPLYYFLHENGEISFGSELKCIFENPKVPRRVCLEGLNLYLRLNYVPGPYTLVEGIRKLMPGRLLEWKSGRCTSRSYVPPSSADTPRSLDEACEQLDLLLKDAMREQLVADVPVGIWLSGGIDSSTVLHYAAENGASHLRTFSITFRGHSFDESGYIEQVARRYGTHHTEFDLTPDADLAGAIEQMAYYSDEPSADAGALPLWFLAGMTRPHVTVVLSGEGADELFGGYLTYRANRYNSMMRKVPLPLRQAALRAAALVPVSDEKIGFEYKLKRFLHGSLLSPDEAHIFWNGTFTEKEKSRLFYAADHASISRLLNGSPLNGLQRYLDFDQRFYLPDDILYKVDRMSMAHSLEARPPFLDQRIVDFAASLPARWKLHGAQSKYILRWLMKGKLPRTVVHRPKIGFDIPVHKWFREGLRPLLLDTLSQEAIVATGLFHWPAVKELITDHLERRANVGYHLWGLTTLLLWMRMWKIEMAPAWEDQLATAVSAD